MAGEIRWSSYNIKVKVGEYEVSGVTDIPDLGATPEKIDVTSLVDPARRYVDGVKDFSDVEFSLLYESGAEGNYAKLAAIEETCKGADAQPVNIVVEFPDGATFTFSGFISLKVNGVGVNAAITFAMSVALNSDIVYAAAQ